MPRCTPSRTGSRSAIGAQLVPVDDHVREHRSGREDAAVDEMTAGFTVVVLEHVVEDVEWPHRVQPAGKILDADRLCCEGHGGDRSHGDGDDGEEVVDDELAGTMP